MSARLRIEGYAIVSRDGMIADATGQMPPGLVNPADQHFLDNGLARADLIIHGRNSHEGHRSSPQRRRLVLTRSVTAPVPHPDYPNALLWNPEAVSLQAARAALGVTGEIVAVIGGTAVYARFLPCYSVFHLSRAAKVRLPGGRPVFPGIPPQRPEDVLMQHGLVAVGTQILDAAAEITVQTWRKD